GHARCERQDHGPVAVRGHRWRAHLVLRRRRASHDLVDRRDACSPEGHRVITVTNGPRMPATASEPLVRADMPRWLWHAVARKRRRAPHWRGRRGSHQHRLSAPGTTRTCDPLRRSGPRTPNGAALDDQGAGQTAYESPAGAALSRPLPRRNGTRVARRVLAPGPRV